MALSQDLVSQFAKLANNDNTENNGTIIKGTYRNINGVDYVQLDGSDILTPVDLMVEADTNDRVQVLIKDHIATVTGNITSPSANSKSVNDLKDEVDEHGNTIKQLDNSITQQGNSIIQIENNVNQQGNTINQHNNLINQHGDQIVSINNTILAQGNAIEANNNSIIAQGNLIDSMNNTITQHGNNINQMNNTISQQGNTISQQGNTIQQQGNTITEFGSNITILNSAFAIVDGRITGLSQAVVDELVTQNLNALYANIDFSNIQIAAIASLFSESGIIDDLVVSQGKITGELVGVTIKGDLIEANTIAADKLVVRGDDGLYYKLNIDGLNNISTQEAGKFTLLETEPDDWDTNYSDYYTIDNNVYHHVLNRLPTEYQEVEYIKTTGTQYIDTGVIGKNGISAELKFELSTKDNGSLLGNRMTGTTRFWPAMWYNNKWNSTIAVDSYSTHSTTINANTIYTTYFKSDSSGWTFDVNNNRVSSGNLTVNNTNNMWMFGTNNNDSSTLQYPFKGKAYYAKIWNGDELVRYFIPCYRKSDNKPGLYDLVNNVFYTNNGTGEFSIGSPINNAPEWTENTYYKLSSTYENALDGSNIVAHSIVAEKIAVDDLVAFGATIGGFNITNSAIHTPAKTSAESGVRGVYLGVDGQFAVGDSTNYLKYYKDSNDQWNFELKANTIKMSTNRTIEEEFERVREETTVLLQIESSRGTVFKNDQVSTVLSVAIYRGMDRITDMTTLRQKMGNSVYLQWKWKRLNDNDYSVISASDSRIGQDGFTFTLNPQDVDTKVTFLCELIN